MAFYTKIALLVLNEDQTKFLVCQKSPENVTGDYIMPGGQLDEPDHLRCLEREIEEELSCQIVPESIELIGEYEDIAAGHTDKTVHITLYSGSLLGEPEASSEIKRLHWIGKDDSENPSVSAIIRNKIIPVLISRNLLR